MKWKTESQTDLSTESILKHTRGEMADMRNGDNKKAFLSYAYSTSYTLE